jgi:hypothetical protein
VSNRQAKNLPILYNNAEMEDTTVEFCDECGLHPCEWVQWKADIMEQNELLFQNGKHKDDTPAMKCKLLYKAYVFIRHVNLGRGN